MNNSTPIKDMKNTPSLFRVAAQFEDPATRPLKPVTSLKQTPFADLMLHPEKVEPVLAATRTADRTTHVDSATTAMQTPAPETRGGHGKASLRPSLVKTEFRLEAPEAVSVKLAAGFTDWEKSPIEMAKLKSGVWRAVIPLPPGDHSYRFIVDGQWCDDPHPAMCVSNPFGTVNAVRRVA